VCDFSGLAVIDWRLRRWRLWFLALMTLTSLRCLTRWVCFSVGCAGQQQQFRSLALGQRPFLEAPFGPHLRDVEALRRRDNAFKASSSTSSSAGLSTAGGAGLTGATGLPGAPGLPAGAGLPAGPPAPVAASADESCTSPTLQQHHHQQMHHGKSHSRPCAVIDTLGN